MALLILNDIPFTIDNQNILRENHNISSNVVTDSNTAAYLSAASQTLDIDLMFTDVDEFFVHQIALMRASLELAIEIAWKNIFPTNLLLCSYIGRDEYMKWGYCHNINFSSQAEDNKKIITMSFTPIRLQSIQTAISSIVSVDGGVIV